MFRNNYDNDSVTLYVLDTFTPGRSYVAPLVTINKLTLFSTQLPPGPNIPD